jgi:hypothetical protein
MWEHQPQLVDFRDNVDRGTHFLHPDLLDADLELSCVSRAAESRLDARLDGSGER